MDKPIRIDLTDIPNLIYGETIIWTFRTLMAKVESSWSYPIVEYPNKPHDSIGTLLVIGGGVIIDRAKIWRKNNNPNASIIAIPSIWGSGAETTSIAVLNIKEKKEIYIGKDLLPDLRAIWPELAKSIPERLIPFACGDTWTHALEGFLSPLASSDLKLELSQLIKELCKTPIENDPAWFELSSRASTGQARSSVGLVHGIAHVLEGVINESKIAYKVRHAQLCAIFIWPVMKLNISIDKSLDSTFNEYGIDLKKIMIITKSLFSEKDFQFILPFLKNNWKSILLDPSTRTNCVLVRPHFISYFEQGDFL